MSKELKKIKLKKSKCKAFFSLGIMALEWQDKIPVNMLTTCHSTANVTDTGKKKRQNDLPVLKPQVVQDCNRGMGDVDREDQQLTSFPIMRRYAKGYKKTVFCIMDIAVCNSYILSAKIAVKQVG
ncbi:hypothetical protein HPB48_014253 [Haemaphysalis longicornis]|uniref:PiggyBac transposable element-derived protein domain-containing protein n=1 Tax=Haemaphysalis longicornis TaxID=44386 RepID=A0A9J6FIW9_HAELO|nr:hypothetical protein HPB48_014253 [Haemaphysalis longicornis]